MVVQEGERPTLPPPRPLDKVLLPLQSLFQHNLAGALLLLAAAVIAVLLANSPLAPAFEHLLHTSIAIRFGDALLEKSLQHWINDGLMGIFFFFVGLEIKREVRVGELSTLKQAALPAVGALGGMVFPALIYAAINFGSKSMGGWGIPMATDIAFALGVVALLGDHVPKSLKVFLTALAIVDDIGAVLVIAVFYTDNVALLSLFLGGVILVISLIANRLQLRSTMFYLVLGLMSWLAFVQSGVHATVAAILMAFTIPAQTRLNGTEFLRNIRGHLAELVEHGKPKDRDLNTAKQHQVFIEMKRTVDFAISPLQRLETVLAVPVTFIVLPIFALANAGVPLHLSLGDAFSSKITLGVFFGLVLGKPLGVFVSAWIAIRLGVAELPKGVTLVHLLGAGLLAGVGFTMALFISALAFTPAALLAEAKLGVMTASVFAGLTGYAWLRFLPSTSDPGSRSLRNNVKNLR
ncbi:MAG: Na+/H+ antiporter NhaA [Myxococcales bacterium]|nr:MAG: Na+/H+ antiporter NhaA [Myxococcales bacterium]